jgi:hypothetical protein
LEFGIAVPNNTLSHSAFLSTAYVIASRTLTSFTSFTLKFR